MFFVKALDETDDDQTDIASLFDSLKHDLSKMMDGHESFLKQRNDMAKTFNLLNIGELSHDASSAKSNNIQKLTRDSQICIDTLKQQEIIGENFVLNSFKLFHLLIEYEKKLKDDMEQNSEK